MSSYNVYILRRTLDGHRWLVGVEQLKPGKKVRLIHPLSKAPLKKFFPGECPGLLRDFCPLRISTGFNLALFSGPYIREKNGGVIKLVYWKNPKKSEDGSLMVLYNNGALRCFGSNERSGFVEIIHRENRVLDDIIKWSIDKFVAVDKCGRLYLIEHKYNSISVTTKLASVANICELSPTRRKRLLESNGELYLVVNKDCSNMRLVELEVYVLNNVTNKWDELSSLGDRILFMSSDNCFFVESSDLFPGRCFRNCILFSENCFESMVSDSDSQDKLLFRKEAEYLELVGVHEYNKSPNFRLLSSCSAPLSTAFWPPDWFFFRIRG